MAPLFAAANNGAIATPPFYLCEANSYNGSARLPGHSLLIISYRQFAFTKLYFPNNFLRLFGRLCRLFARFCRVIFHKCSEFDQICQIAKSQKTRSLKAEMPHFQSITRRESENALSSTFFN